MRGEPDAVRIFGPGEVHVWWALARDLRAPDATARFEAWLSGDETERYRRFRRAEDRELFLLARALLRRTLSRYADVAPEEWRFVNAEGGAPELDAPFDALGLQFSVSHTPGLVACLVGRGVSGGVDVEQVGRVPDFWKPAAMVCSEAEREELGRLAPDRARDRFYRLWTLKEAYVKARGAGMRIPMNGVTFGGGEGPAPLRVSFDAPVGDDSRDWEFALWRPSPEHQGAVAVRRGAGPGHTFVYRPALGLAVQ